MKKIQPKKKETGKLTPENLGMAKPKKKLNQAFLRNIERVKNGECLNPAGRPKGSRNKFAEAFVNDFLKDWETHGSETIVRVREEDPSTYIRVSSTLLPKDFNINSQNEAALDKLLDQFDEDGIKQLLAGLQALGAESVAESEEI